MKRGWGKKTLTFTKQADGFDILVIIIEGSSFCSSLYSWRETEMTLAEDGCQSA